MRVVILALLLTGCASFSTPSLHEQLTEAHACSQSALCRTLIEDRPLPLIAASGLDPDDAVCLLRAYGVQAEQRMDTHGAWVAAQVDGRWYALRDSWYCNGICRIGGGE